jgi:hypothetical protein
MACEIERDLRSERLATTCYLLVSSLERRLAEIDHAMQILAVQVREAEERREVIRAVLDDAKGRG